MALDQHEGPEWREQGQLYPRPDRDELRAACIAWVMAPHASKEAEFAKFVEVAERYGSAVGH